MLRSTVVWGLILLQSFTAANSEKNYLGAGDDNFQIASHLRKGQSTPAVDDSLLARHTETVPSPYLSHRDDGDELPDLDKPPRLADAAPSALEKARELVRTAIQQAAEQNKARLANPMRNNYVLSPNTNIKPAGSNARAGDLPADAPIEPEPAPLFNVTAEIAAAAALVAEAEAFEEVSGNSTLKRRYIEEQAARLKARRLNKRNRPSGYWLANTSHKGSWPFGKKDDSFPVFRDVTDPRYGAVGDGIHDDTEAIRKAVEDGGMCGPKCYSSTTQGAIIFFPPGTYLVSGTIETYYGTQFIGDPKDRPVIKAAASFVGLGVISTNKYVENGGTGSDGLAKQWFINTANFYRQIRNFVIDITDTQPGAYVAALHYQVAQATSLQFVEFRAKTGTTQQGIFAENGSGGFISDLVFNGGNFGIYGGAQQFTVQRVTFNGCKTAVQLIWDWGWSWQGIYIKDAEVGFKLLSEDGAHNTGSLLVIDSVFENVQKAIYMFPAEAKTGDGTTGLTLDNVKFAGTVGQGVVDTAGKVYLSGQESVDTFVLGRIYHDQQKLEAISDTYESPRKDSWTGENKWGLPKNPYFERAKPQYEDVGSGDIHHVKDSCKGDGVSDDTRCVQDAIDRFASSGIIFFDAGSYIISDTITVPPGAKIVGENWSQLVAFGSNFGDEKNPRPLVRVGEEGSKGSVELQDLIFTSKGPTAGVVFVEWNILSDGPGKAGMWDCHVRVGGASGTDLTVAECPAGGYNDKCKAGSALMHVTSKASGYFENVWLWVADHDIDDPLLEDDNNDMEQCSIYVARGLLVESTEPTFLYGTSSEHAVLYQYEFFNAKNVLASMIQTESPYYQPKPSVPSPFENALGDMPGDPEFKCTDAEPCDSSWALRIINSTDIMVHGAGLYSWFNDYTQDCLQTMDCQSSLIDLQGNFGGVKIHNLITIGAVNMINSDGLIVKAADNQAVDFHPRWSQVAVFDPKQFTNPCTGMPDDTRPTVNVVNAYPVRTDEDDPYVLLTIVNGSPYDIEFLGKNSHQLTDWDNQWATIPAGDALQGTVEYSEGIGIVNRDTAGEAYYGVKGTDKKWHIAARYNEGVSPHQRVNISYTDLETNGTPRGTLFDLGWPSNDDGLVVQWVLTGSEEYGWYDSRNPPVAWMRAIRDVIGERKLKHVCMPGSHDAGMNKIDGKTPFVDWKNTQTQWLDIYGQAVRGSRWFDVRPCLGNGGKHMTCHYTVTEASAVGGNGISVDETIDQINDFMRQHPGELLIIDLNNESGYDTDNPTSPVITYKRLTDEQWAPIVKKFIDRVERPCKNLKFGDSGQLDDLTMNTFIGDGQGCVLTVGRGVGNTPETPSSGYYYSGRLPRYNRYAETANGVKMALDQTAKLKSNRRIGKPGDGDTTDEFFILSWTLTVSAEDFETPIATHAARAMSTLFSYAYRLFTPYSFPNVLYVDYMGQGYLLDQGKSQSEYIELTQNHMTGLALAVNLHLASQNCYVGGGKI